MRPLVWFRSDLRTRDHRALHAACAAADDGVVAVYVVCPDQWKEHDWADARVDFVLRNLRELSDALDAMRVPLRIRTCDRFDGVPGELLRLARETGCDALFFNEEYEVNERARDRRVRRAFSEEGLRVDAFVDQTILEPGSVKTKDGGWYSVFTPFKRAWIERFLDEEGLDPLPRPRPQAEIDVARDPVPDAVRGFARDAGRPDLWQAGEEHALARLRAFARDRLEDYAERRDAPAVNGTSTLSPYLTSGVLSPRQCLHAARERNAGRLRGGGKTPNGPETWIGELIWREFYKHLLIGYPRLSKNRPFREETAGVPWRDAPDDLRAWQEGRTGFPIVDAAMRQLERTGWMHNRLRMIVAMFLTKDLLIHWSEGERWFMRRLVDGDLAANNGGWQWSASTGTDAAPYFRIFNPTTQGERYDPEGAFVRKFVPELADLTGKDLHDPSRLDPDRRAALDYPEPICDHSAARERALAAFKGLK